MLSYISPKRSIYPLLKVLLLVELLLARLTLVVVELVGVLHEVVDALHHQLEVLLQHRPVASKRPAYIQIDDSGCKKIK